MTPERLLEFQEAARNAMFPYNDQMRELIAELKTQIALTTQAREMADAALITLGRLATASCPDILKQLLDITADKGKP